MEKVQNSKCSIVLHSSPNATPRLHRIDNRSVIVTLVPNKLKKLRQRHVVLMKKGPIASASIHQIGIHLAPQFDSSFGDQSR